VSDGWVEEYCVQIYAKRVELEEPFIAKALRQAARVRSLRQGLLPLVGG
jgi:hypothetical protein